MEESGVFGEGNFVIVNPARGLLVLEVKGGNIEQTLLVSERPNRCHAIRAQADEFVNKLIHRLDRDHCSQSPLWNRNLFCRRVSRYQAAPGHLWATAIGNQDPPWIG
jgi:hypothetical protein